MRTRTKMFYCADWESGWEVENEYRTWLSQYENSYLPTGFRFVAKQKKGNWIIVWYHADGNPK
jgi:hypothetical protein